MKIRCEDINRNSATCCSCQSQLWSLSKDYLHTGFTHCLFLSEKIYSESLYSFIWLLCYPFWLQVAYSHAINKNHIFTYLDTLKMWFKKFLNVKWLAMIMQWLLYISYVYKTNMKVLKSGHVLLDICLWIRKCAFWEQINIWRKKLK